MADAFWSAPPVTRTLVALMVIESCLVYGGFLNGMRVVFSMKHIFTFPPEIWRCFTAFLITGPQLAIIFDPYFVWMYGVALERDSTRFTGAGDFFTYILFVGTFIILTAGGIFGSMIFTQALILAIAYTYAQENRGKQIKFFIIDMDVKWLPYALLALNFILSGPQSAKIQFCGLPAAHLYDFLTHYWPEFGGGWNVVQTPAFVARWFGADPKAKRVVVKKHGIAYKSPDQATGSASGSSLFSSGWGSRGQGRRLGGD